MELLPPLSDRGPTEKTQRLLPRGMRLVCVFHGEYIPEYMIGRDFRLSKKTSKTVRMRAVFGFAAPRRPGNIGCQGFDSGPKKTITNGSFRSYRKRHGASQTTNRKWMALRQRDFHSKHSMRFLPFPPDEPVLEHAALRQFSFWGFVEVRSTLAQGRP